MTQKLNKTVLAWRLGLLAVCTIVAVTCLYMMNQTFDPLARYPYADEANREEILSYMDSEDIDYIINQQIRPDQFMEYIEVPGFNVHNTLFYAAAGNAQPDDPEYIVGFVNRYRDRLDLDSLAAWLQAYSYSDLAAYFDSGQQATLALDPTSMYMIMDGSQTVWRYVPDGLVMTDSVYLQPEAAQALEAMNAAWQKVNPDDSLTPMYGYLSFDELNAMHQADESILPGGQNEMQLGYTVVLDGRMPETAEEGKVQELTEQQKKVLDRANWLQENAWRYGFYIESDQTPFVLRYVGETAANDLRSSQVTLEDLQ